MRQLVNKFGSPSSCSLEDKGIYTDGHGYINYVVDIDQGIIYVTLWD